MLSISALNLFQNGSQFLYFPSNFVIESLGRFVELELAFASLCRFASNAF